MESANDLKKLLHDNGLVDVRVLQAHYFTYYIDKDDGELSYEELHILKQIFFKIKRCEEADLVKARTIKIECRGLPLIA